MKRIIPQLVQARLFNNFCSFAPFYVATAQPVIGSLNAGPSSSVDIVNSGEGFNRLIIMQQLGLFSVFRDELRSRG
jgi:hypothetical protein